MHESQTADRERVARLEMRVRTLIGLNLITLSFVGVTVLTGFSVRREPGGAADTLSVRELRLLDSMGIVRVRLSANMPDAVIHGRRVHRPEQASGIMLYDDLGQERGGYVTFTPSRSIALTLDTRQNQVATFAADSSGGAALGMFEADNRLEIRASKTTGTGLSVWKDGGLVLQDPPLSDTEEAKVCTEMKDEIAAAEARMKQQIDQARVIAACKLHMSENGCRTCFAKGSGGN